MGLVVDSLMDCCQLLLQLTRSDLNLKLNADRLDARITEYFDTVVFLGNAGWTEERIADFLDRSA